MKEVFNSFSERFKRFSGESIYLLPADHEMMPKIQELVKTLYSDWQINNLVVGYFDSAPLLYFCGPKKVVEGLRLKKVVSRGEFRMYHFGTDAVILIINWSNKKIQDLIDRRFKTIQPKNSNESDVKQNTFFSVVMLGEDKNGLPQIDAAINAARDS